MTRHHPTTPPRKKTKWSNTGHWGIPIDFLYNFYLGAIYILRNTRVGALITGMCNRFEHQKLNQMA